MKSESNVSRMTEKKLHRRIVLLTALFLLCVAAISVWFLAKCRVKTLEIVGTDVVSQVSVMDAAAIRADTHLYAVDLDSVASDVRAVSPYIRSVKVRRVLFQGIRITVDEYPARYYLQSESGCLILSEELIPLEFVPDELSAAEIAPTKLSLPPIKQPAFGKKIEFADADSAAPKLLSTFRTSVIAPRVSAIDLSSTQDIRAELDGGKYTFLCGSPDGLSEKLHHCGETLAYLDRTMKHVSGILRAEGTGAVSFEMTGVVE